MDDAKRKALIKAQVAKKKESIEVNLKGTSSSHTSKRKMLPKGDHPTKKLKVRLEPIVGLMARGTKTVIPAKHGAEKG